MVFVYVHYGVKSDRPSQEHFHLVGYLFWRYPPRKLLFPRTPTPSHRPAGPDAASPSHPRMDYLRRQTIVPQMPGKSRLPEKLSLFRRIYLSLRDRRTGNKVPRFRGN